MVSDFVWSMEKAAARFVVVQRDELGSTCSDPSAWITLAAPRRRGVCGGDKTFLSIRCRQRPERMPIIGKRTRNSLSNGSRRSLSEMMMMAPLRATETRCPGRSSESALVGRCIEVGRFIHHDDVVFQSEESMGEAYGM
jgi:hypothetical protein